MKVSPAASEPFSANRRRALLEAGAQGQGAPMRDASAFMGLGEVELTPSVRAALATLVAELEDLRSEIARLKARLAEAEEAADRDPLTPVKNRRAFCRELHRIATFARRYGSPASLIYFDLDGFKAVNDRYGHAAGDAALQAVAERLTANVRESDIVGRMGGDEFAVVLIQADRQTAEAKAASLAALIEGQPVRFGDWSAPLHVSYGVCEIDPENEPETSIAQADAAMFVSKRVRQAAGA
ncbi:MAG TPA: GGDEF domain-containing protein [Caulobacteraceae bacterium]|nr:GGDEF domain-containing protein [Caulobacteraceae bacterium]